MTTYFLKHTNDLKKHFYLISSFFLITFFINCWFCNQWVYLLLKPLLKLTTNNYLIITEITEIFFVKIFLIFFASCSLTILFAFAQIWIFLFSGLFKLENYYIVKWFIIFLISLILSIYFTVIYIIPTLWVFFINLLDNPNNYLYNYFFEPKLEVYLHFIIKILISIVLISQYPLFLIICLNNNFLTINTLIKFRKIFYLFIYFITALITPPSIEVQFVLTCFFTLIFELIIYFYIY